MSSITTDEHVPGCLVLLMQMSASMSRDIPTYMGEFPKFHAIQLLIDEIIEDQIVALSDGRHPIFSEICVVGYRGSEDAPTTVVSLLPGGITKPHFVKLSDLAVAEVHARRAKQPRKWCSNTELQGSPDPVAALAEVHWLVQRWLAEHPGSSSPVVVHCGDGTGLTSAYELVARSLTFLNGVEAPAVLCHFLFSEMYSGRFLPNLYCGNLPESFQRLWEASSCVPPPAQPNCLGHPPRALTINEWSWCETQIFHFPDRIVPPAEVQQTQEAEAAAPPEMPLPESPAMDAAITEQSPVVESVAAVEPAPVAEVDAAQSNPLPEVVSVAEDPVALFSYRALWLHKGGNFPKEWEDSFHVDPLRGTVVVTDGAGEGIFCRQWAALLAESWAQDRPDLDNPVAYGGWLNSCRTAWMERINYPNTRPTQRMKVNDVGAAATFLGFWIERLDGPSDQAARYAWRAIAAGDSCMFWVRGATLLATFPLTRGAQFRLPPLLVRTKRLPPPAVARAGGVCEIGDLFLLATDAVSRNLIDENDLGPVDWSRFETIDPNVWEQEIQSLRRQNLIVNDDCTLVVIRIGSPAPMVVLPETSMLLGEAEPPGEALLVQAEIVGDS